MAVLRSASKVAAAVLAVALLSCSRAPTTPPNVVVVLIDTLRADRLGAYGSTRGLTPFLDELATRGTVFLNAYSATSWTAPAVASLFTSRYPGQTQIATYDSRLADTEVTLAERLQQGGYVPAAFLANSQVSADHGFSQGFEHWWTDKVPKVPASAVRAQALDWLDSGDAHVPAFLYLHFLEPHAPYEPPEPFRSRLKHPVDASVEASAQRKMHAREWTAVAPAERDLLESLYDGEVAAIDAELRILFDELERRGVLRNAIVVVTADHGEEFKDHGGMGHGLTLYNELIHVPLIVVVPNRPGGRRVQDNVSLVDVAPTLLDLVGLPHEPHFEGRSLAPFLADPATAHGPLASLQALVARLRGTPQSLESPSAVDIFFELLPNGASYDLRRHGAGIIRGSLKLVVPPHGAAVVYDLSRDPGETGPGSIGGAGQATTLEAALHAEQGLLQARASTAATVPLDEAAREKLRALGYNP
jgi:arylsulfatase